MSLTLMELLGFSQPDSLTTAEAAALLTERGVLVKGRGKPAHPPTARTVEQWCRAGKIDSYLIGSGTRAIRQIRRAALEAFEQPAMGRPAQAEPH